MIVVATATLAQTFGLGEALDRRIHDTFIRIAPSEGPRITPAFPDVSVVTIDPRSLRASAAWPWPRSVHAEAVDRLEAAGARAIAFDIDFSSASSEDLDRRFASSLHRSGKVVLAAFSQRELLDGGLEFEVANRPIPMLEAAAAGLGSVLVPIDPDGVVRNAPRSSAINGDDVPSLARAALRVAASEDLKETVRAAVDSSDATLVDFRRSAPAIPTIPFVDLMEGRFDPASIAGRAIFIGATAAEFQDLWATPSQPALPGVMIQAIAYRTAAAEAVGDEILAAAKPAWSVLALLLLGVLTMPRSRHGLLGRSALFAAAGGVVLVGGWFALWHWAVTTPTSVALALLGAQYALGIETLQKRIRLRAEAQESSLNALAVLGDATMDAGGDETRVECHARSSGHGGSLELALELLGDVVSARGVVLLRATPTLDFRDERLEWWPDTRPDTSLSVDLEEASRALHERRTIESGIPSAHASVVYAPLLAASEQIGVLVVFRSTEHALDGLHRRTIATVGAQIALTAQNLQLIDRLRETFESSIAAVAGAVEARDGYTDQHCRRLAAFSSLMGTRLGMPEDEIRAMELGALLHDVGKIGVPDAILNKPGRLTDEERREMQRHPEIGAGIVAPVVGLDRTTLDCVIHHHECWNGTGYPEGLAGDEIPLAARIVSIVDVWDALSTARPYKAAYNQAEVRDRLLKGRGIQFDPELVDLFFEILETQGDEMLDLVARSSSQQAVS